MRVNIDIKKESIFVSADIDLTERALENLIENAIHYTDMSSTVIIEVSEKSGHGIFRI